MTGESTNSQKIQLAAAIAQGTAVEEWASANNVARSTAFRWAKEPEVRAEIESIRRGALDQAMGLMARCATWAVRGIVDLADNATSESVRLSALRAIYSELTAGTTVAGIEARVTKLEEQSDARTGNAS